MRSLAAVAVVAALAGCFSKPEFQGQRDAGNDDGPFDGVPDGPLPHPAVAKLAVGLVHACRVSTSGAMICWGSNERGQLGRDTTAALWSGTPGYAFDGTSMASGWTTVAAGHHHTCGVRAGEVFCWGDNGYGQAHPSGTPNPLAFTDAKKVDVPGTVERVFAGAKMSCAINTAGEAYCWGYVDFDVNATLRDVTPLAPASRFTHLALADDHACGLTDAGRVRCWGLNDSFQLGQLQEAVFANAPPIDDTGLFVAVTATEGVTCAIRDNGDLVCWGRADRGHLGNTQAAARLPLTMDSSHDWTHVAAGIDHLCGVGGGALFCYGNNYLGALGDGRYQGHLPLGPEIPKTVTIGELAASNGHGCYLADDGDTTYCWGSNGKGELGNRASSRKIDPVKVNLSLAGSDTVEEIVAGDDHTCARISTGTTSATYCWGLDDEGQVSGAGGLPSSYATPQIVANSANFIQLAAGGRHTCARTAGAGAIECWGSNGSYQLGSANMLTFRASMAAPSPGWSFVDVGSRTTCAIANGELYCWGTLIGNTTTPSSATKVLYGTMNGWQWRSVSIGSGYAVGVVVDPGNSNAPHLAGWGSHCEAGIRNPPMGVTDPTPTPREIWAAIQPLSPAPLVSAAEHAGDHACMHRTTGVNQDVVTCWGKNAYGQLGVAAGNNCYDLQTVTTLTLAPPDANVPRLHAASEHTCMLDSAGKLWCWGLNSNFELGNATSGSTPSLANTGTWTKIAGGRDHTCGISATDGEVYCWGENQFGQVGDGTRYEPAPVVAGVVP